jgi:integrase
MAIAKVTKTVVDSLDKGQRVWDTNVKGFGIRRQTTDAVWYLLRYATRQGQERTISIGRHGSPWTPDSARNEARRLLGLVASGRDPLAEKKQQRDVARYPGPIELTFANAVERYLAYKQDALKPGSQRQVIHHLRNLAKPLHPLKLSEIDRRRIAELLHSIQTASGPVARNNTRATITAMFTWLIREGLLEANPATYTAKADVGPSRDRVLRTPAELAEVWAALPANHYGDIVRLLILTGCRRDEIAKLQWSEIDFDKALIVLPPARTKNKTRFELPLLAQALAILQRSAVNGSPTSPPSHGSSSSTVNGSSFPCGNDGAVFDGVGWTPRGVSLNATIIARRREIDPKAKPIPNWRLHDLRRTVATMMADMGILPHHIEAVLNHVSGTKAGVAGIYNRSKYLPEMREALRKWGNYIDEITAQ